MAAEDANIEYARLAERAERFDDMARVCTRLCTTSAQVILDQLCMHEF